MFEAKISAAMVGLCFSTGYLLTADTAITYEDDGINASVLWKEPEILDVAHADASLIRQKG